MSSHRRPRIAPAVAFREAVDATGALRLLPGLQAVKDGEGKGQIAAGDPRSVLGSVAMDEDCRKAHPRATRWDYVIGYDRASEAVAFFVEVHSAETSEVSKMEDKLRWLNDFLGEAPQSKLAALSRRYHWVASGRINIPEHTPQFKRLTTTLRKLGLNGPVKSLLLA